MIRPWLPLLFAAAASGCGADADPEPLDAGTGSATERVVTLAPHLAELVFAAGAGDRLVGVSAWSDFPPAALDVPIVSDAFTVDLEVLAGLEPTIILAWQSGTPVHVVDELENLGYRVETVTTRGLEDVALALERIGALAGSDQAAARAAGEYRAEVASLREAYDSRPAISVFYQVSARPLYTIAGGHYIEEIVTLCGGRNVFDDVDELAPAITVESVVSRDPDVILAGSAQHDPFAEWARWPELGFNRYDNRFTVPADEIGRATPRLTIAAAALCAALDEGRARRDGYAGGG